MNRDIYERKEEDMNIGRRVKNLVPLRNGMFAIPVGTIFTITREQKGMHLRSEPCPHCGIASFISCVPPQDVTFI